MVMKLGILDWQLDHICQFPVTLMKLLPNRHMLHITKIDDFSMLKTDSTTADNHRVLWILVLMIWGMIQGLAQTFNLAKWREVLDCLAITLMMVTLLLILVILIVTIIPVLR